MTAERKKRHLRILEIISTRQIETQEELAEALRAEEWSVTQSSVSRDITSLGLVKVDGAYAKPGRVRREHGDPDERRIAEGLLTVDRAGEALLVIHTPPGEANRVAVALDRLAWTELLGTIAGDDTIFVAVPDGRAQREVMKRLAKLGG
jgi:transcriptional regulator of arginine metabolism